jgi:hypothetical protein
MKSKTISPKVDSLQWGEIRVSGQTYKDAKLFPGGSRTWDWNETGTRHVPGIQPGDIEELLEHDAEIIILSKGINERLQTADETKVYLDEQDCPYHILQSEEAVEKYNALCTSKPVGALIHSTC